MVDRITQCLEQKAKASHFNLAFLCLVLRTRQYPYVLLELILLGFVLRTRQYPYVLLELTLYIPVNNFSVMFGFVFLDWISTKQRIKCPAQGHNTVTPPPGSESQASNPSIPNPLLSEPLHSANIDMDLPPQIADCIHPNVTGSTGLHGTSSRGYHSYILQYSILNCLFIDFVDTSDLTWQGIDKYGSISKTMNGIMLPAIPAPPSLLLYLKTLQRVHWQTVQAQETCSRYESRTIHIPSVLIQT